MIYLLAALIAAVLLILAEIYRETHRFVVTEYEIRTPKLPPEMEDKRIVFLSDLHNREYGEENGKLLEKIREQKPDLILCGGDMLVANRNTHGGRESSWGKAAECMKKLTEFAPVYCALGNHEQRMLEDPENYGDSYWKYKKELEQAGIHFLVNESCEMEWEGTRVLLYGMKMPSECYARFGRMEPSLQDMKDGLGQADPQAWNVLMVHHPEFVTIYKEWGADLILSGHLHGGVMRLPVLGGVISPQVGLFPKYSGDCYKEGDTSIVVSKGLGTHTINIRLFNPAELIVLHIHGM